MNTAIFLLLAAAALVTLGGAAAEPPPPPQMGCTDELVRFSPCLPYVSSPPNNLSDSVRPKCCDAFSSSLESGAAVCLCYLIQDPAMLGFPVNDTRVLSLPSVCPLRGNSTNIWSATSFESLCSGSPELPPLRSTTISGISSPPDSGTDNASSPLMGTTPNSTTNSSTQPGNSSSSPPSSAVEPARVSGATKQTNSINAWFLPALMSFQFVFLHFLQ